jgi:hypothetical protein
MEGHLHSARKRLTLHASSCEILAALKELPAQQEVSFVTVQSTDLDGYRAQGIKVADRCPCLKPPKELPPHFREGA